ncbi:ribonucleotide reductase N-terminal alpha domain-containing protein, partial [Hydrogenivirga sp. 128-5-R1-1]|uniref:ribonucleotide reductase N-terminal alpha domain-containing protein n=1 Tax=Hydrogenivirga sp. 128-5-R1-1 TaxID=392423 RepID=UPI00015F3304
MERIVVKRDGTEEKFQMKKLINAIFALFEGMDLPDDWEIAFKIAKELDLKIPERVTTEELDFLVLKAIEQLIPTHYIYDTLASRQLQKIINRKIDKRFKSFKEALEYGVKEGLYKEDILNFDLEKIENAIDYERDNLLDYFGMTTLKDRYFTKDRNGEIIEKPQWFFMRVALGIGNNEDEVIKVYNKISKLEYLHSTPTLYNSGTITHQYSSCYVNVIDDSLESIMDKAKETAFLAKYAGGVGTDVTRIRATGSAIKSLNAKSSGVIPFIKIFDTIVNAIQQGGRRRSSQVMYLQPWHLDIDAFLDLRETTGNPYFRTPSLNTAIWMPDEIMRRIKEGEPLYLFDPAECPELVASWGKDFTEKYFECIEKAETGEIKLWKKIDSQEWFRRYLFKLAKTGHPWLTFKDRHNEHNPCPEYGVINSSNLCVTGDTRLATQWGLVEAEELFEKGEAIIATYDKRTNGNWKDYGVSTAQCLKMFKTKENADVYEVITKEGYKIKATDWHEFYRAVPDKLYEGKYAKEYKIEKVKLSDLKPGDKLLIQSGEGQFGTEGYYELGLVIGLIAGDGTFAEKKGYKTAYIDLYNNEISISEI